MLPQSATPTTAGDLDPVILGRLRSLAALPSDCLVHEHRVWYERQIRQGAPYHVEENEWGWTLYHGKDIVDSWMKGITPQRKNEA